MSTSNFLTAFNQGFYSIGHNLKKKSPEIFLGFGIAGVIFASVDACKRTLALPEIVERHEHVLEEIKANVNEDGETVETTKGTVKVVEATAQVQAHFCVEVAKLYALPVTVGALSIGAIIGSHCIMSRRYAQAVSAYVAVSEAFRSYRERTKERVGEELERKIRYNIVDEDVDEEYVDAKGKTKTRKKKVEVVDNPGTFCDDYTAFFTSFTAPTEWNGSMNLNRLKITQVERWANERLEREKRLFVNDILRDLGIEQRASGQYVGWVYSDSNSVGDNRIIIKVDPAKFKNPKTGMFEPGFILEFNADGNILETGFNDDRVEYEEAM